MPTPVSAAAPHQAAKPSTSMVMAMPPPAIHMPSTIGILRP